MNFLTRGTVEFRYGSGTLHAGKVLGWVQFLYGLVEKAKSVSSVRLNIRNNTKTLREMKDTAKGYVRLLRGEGIRLHTTKTSEVIDERFATFAEARGDAENVPR